GDGGGVGPALAIAEDGRRGAAVAAAQAAHQVGDRRALGEQGAVGGRRLLEAAGRREGADAHLRGRAEAVVLRPGGADLARVLCARAAEVVEEVVLEVAERLALDAEAGAAEVGAVGEVPGAAVLIRVAERAPAEIGGQRTWRVLVVRS